MATERVLSNLNLISFKTEGGLQNHIDELQDGDLVFTPDNSLKGTLLDFKWADHLLNDISWLRGDTFSWHDGEMYKAAYNHLVADFEGAELKRYYAWVSDSGHIYYSDIENVTNGRVAYMYNNGKFTFDPYIYFNISDGAVSVGTVIVTRDASKDKDSIVNSNDDTFGDTTITYYRAEDGHKICLPDQEDKVLALYNKTGVAWYYILDEDNTQFKLPRMKPEKRLPFAEIANADVNGYVAYSQGYGDRGGIVGTSNLWFSSGDGIVFGEAQSKSLSDEGIVNTSVNLDNARINNVTAEQYLYFYVGNFERDAVEQTAGIAAEMFNSKADSDLRNIPANYDYVVESQLPTEANGYTWYRKYKSGWVEQGGEINGTQTNADITITLPIIMANNHYTLIRTQVAGNIQSYYPGWVAGYSTKTTTGFTFAQVSAINVWQVSGQGA